MDSNGTKHRALLEQRRQTIGSATRKPALNGQVFYNVYSENESYWRTIRVVTLLIVVYGESLKNKCYSGTVNSLLLCQPLSI